MRPVRAVRCLACALAALGVVYGDIGTSPLYALKECFAPEYGHRPHRRERPRRALADLLVADPRGLASSTSTFIMRADNRGEGGILALLALLHPAAAGDAPRAAPAARRARALRRGAALRRRRDHAGHLGAGRRRGPRGGDARAAATASCRSPSGLILVALFMVQRRGTARVGAVFGPIMLRLVRHHRGARRRARSLRHPERAGGAQSLVRASSSSVATACAASSCWARWCWW